MLKDKKILLINFISFFIGWIFVLLLGADFPPPTGFIWLVFLVFFLDVIQYFYLNKYFLKRIKKHKKIKLFLANSLFYLFGGFVVSVCTTLPVFTNLKQTISIIWVIVIITVSVLYSIIFWIFNWFLYRLL